jgi:hypothetical protein
MVGRRRVGTAPVTETVKEGWHRLVLDLAVELAGWRDPAVLTLNDDAQALLPEMERHIEAQLGPGGELEHIADWGAKLAGALLRIAALLHLAQHPEDGWRRQIDVDILCRAGRVSEYYRANALLAFDAMRADPTMADAEYLLDVIRRVGRSTVSTRDLFSAASRSRFPKVGDLEPALTMIEEHGHLVLLPPSGQAGPGRRPSPRWSVNPHTFAAETTETARTP